MKLCILVSKNSFVGASSLWKLPHKIFCHEMVLTLDLICSYVVLYRYEAIRWNEHYVQLFQIRMRGWFTVSERACHWNFGSVNLLHRTKFFTENFSTWNKFFRKFCSSLDKIIPQIICLIKPFSRNGFSSVSSSFNKSWTTIVVYNRDRQFSIFFFFMFEEATVKIKQYISEWTVKQSL